MTGLCIPRNPTGLFGSTGQHRECLSREPLIAHCGIRTFDTLPQPLCTTRPKSYESPVFGSAIASQSSSGMEVEPPVKSEPIAKASKSSSSFNKSNPSSTRKKPTSKDESSSHHNDHPEVTAFVLQQTDAEIEALVERIRKNIVIKDVPVKAPQWIEVPRGYLMDLELQPSHFLKIRADARTQVKKRKREAGLPAPGRGWQNRIHGFRPEEVNWNGAVSIEGCLPSNLSNDIHPLFDRSCFDDTPDAIYDQLIPALQLATLFLTEPICMQFWVTLAMGRRVTDHEMSARNGKLSQRIPHHVELTAERAKTVIEHLKKIGKSNLVHYRFNRRLQALDNTDVKGSAYAVSVPICDYQGIDTECHGTNGSIVRSVIRFHADYYIVAKKLSQLRFQEESQKLRFSFGFAVLIVHELAHSIEGIHFRERGHQWLEWQSSKYYKEPYWLNLNETECGRAWEDAMFGGQIQPINRKVDGSHGIAVADWPFGGKEQDPQSYRWWTVSMDWIEHMFQMNTWQRSVDLKNWQIFNIPRDGATSLYINSFSTMNPSEEERVAKEEMAELIAQSNEEPATKKRVTSLGKTEERRPDEKEVIEHAVIDGGLPSTDVSVQRRVPMFLNTRRLSSVMTGPLPDTADISNIVCRPTLTPHTRKTPSSDPSSALDAESGAFSDSAAPISTTSGPDPKPHIEPSSQHKKLRRIKQRIGTTDDSKDDIRKQWVDPANQRTLSRRVNKRIRKPKGILHKYRERKVALRGRSKKRKSIEE